MSKVVVFGSLNMDVSIEALRLPEQGETIDGSNLCINPGGKGANQAVAAARACSSTLMVGAVGADAFGLQLVNSLSSAKVDCSNVRVEDACSSGVAVVLRCSGDNRIVVGHGANYAISPEKVEETIRNVVEPGDVFLTQFECNYSSVVRAVSVAHGIGAYVIVNPSPARIVDDALLACIDMLCLNETECGVITGIASDSDEGILGALKLLRSKGVSVPVITLGETGSVALVGENVVRQPSFNVDAIDSTCAGDTFVGSLAAMKSSGQSLVDSLRYASAAAALATTRIGAQQSIPRMEEVQKAIGKGW